MVHNWVLYIAAFSFAFLISLLTTPVAKRISINWNAIDYPRARSVHKEPIPRMGGLAIVFGFLITLVVILPFTKDVIVTQMIGLAIGALIIVFVGIVDDIYTLGAKVKLVFQIIAALVVVFSGTRIDVVFWPFNTYLQGFSIPITIFWIVGLINAVNLIDGLDGLAAGVSSIGAFCLMILCIITGSELAVVLTAAIAGSCMGFLPRNFSPAEIFMGDTGATFLGYVFAVSSIIGVFKGYTLLAILIAVFSLGLPILDTMFAMFRRVVIEKKSFMQADRGHLHHKLIDSGYSQAQAVMILYGLSFLSACIAILIALRDFRAVITVGIFIFIFSLMFYVYKKRTN